MDDEELLELAKYGLTNYKMKKWLQSRTQSELIELSKAASLLVIARNSVKQTEIAGANLAFTETGPPKKPEQSDGKS